MNEEIKYCKFCDMEKPKKDFCKSGGFTKNICKECQNKKHTQIYRDSKKVELLQKQNTELKEKVNTYENPEDLTLMFMYCDEKAKDKIKELKQDIKNLVKIISKNCDDLEATEEEFESLYRWENERERII